MQENWIALERVPRCARQQQTRRPHLLRGSRRRQVLRCCAQPSPPPRIIPPPSTASDARHCRRVPSIAVLFVRRLRPSSTGGSCRRCRLGGVAAARLLITRGSCRRRSRCRSRPLRLCRFWRRCRRRDRERERRFRRRDRLGRRAVDVACSVKHVVVFLEGHAAREKQQREQRRRRRRWDESVRPVEGEKSQAGLQVSWRRQQGRPRLSREGRSQGHRATGRTLGPLPSPSCCSPGLGAPSPCSGVRPRRGIVSITAGCNAHAAAALGRGCDVGAAACPHHLS